VLGICRYFSLRALGIVVAGLFALVPASTTFAQQDDLTIRPIFVTTRIFQIKAKRDSYPELNGQVFRMSTTSLVEHDQWQKTLKKTYPGFEIDLLRTDARKVFRSSKQTIISLVKQADGRDIEIQMTGAQSLGDGVTPGTTLIAEIALHFGNDLVNKPVSFGVQSVEIEHGKTYFFAVPNLKMRSSDYIKFVRPNAQPELYDGNDLFLLLSFSVELETAKTPARYFDERQSLEFQNQAVKKPLPEVPTKWRDVGLGGNVRIRVEISPEGKITSSNVYYSGFPEMNQQVIEAARQWEFPKTLFETDKTPITCFLTFNFPAQPVQKAPTSNSTKQ
jgi:TonB family protein